jgi:hypothetical protein
MWACACSKIAGMHLRGRWHDGCAWLVCMQACAVGCGRWVCILWCMPHAGENCLHAAWVALWVHMSWQGMLAAVAVQMWLGANVGRGYGWAGSDMLAGGERCRRLLAGQARAGIVAAHPCPSCSASGCMHVWLVAGCSHVHACRRQVPPAGAFKAAMWYECCYAWAGSV